MAGHVGARAAATHGLGEHAANNNQAHAHNHNAPNNNQDNGQASAKVGRDGSGEDALEAALELLGPFGLYQRYILVMLCIPNILAAMYSLNYVFVADQVPFRCVVPECESSSPLFANEPVLVLLPEASCERYAPLYNASLNVCDRDNFMNSTIACDQFVYETQDTTFAEFNMGCREWMRTMVGTVRNSALPFALILTGYISDTYGRRTAFCIFASCTGVLGIVKGISINYQMYLAFEFLEAALGYGFTSAAYVMIIEMARPALRATFACATGMAYGLGGVIFSWLAWRMRYWRHLLFTIHSFALLLPLYWLLIDESARWLHVRGRRMEATAVIRKAARWNKVILDDELMKKLEQSDATKEEETQRPNAWLGLLRSRVLVGRFALCAWCWVAVAFVYYGLTINSVSLSGDKYVNFALNMVMEIVASLLIMMALERFGRKRSIFCAFVLCGVACVTPYFITHEGAILGLFFTGKLAIAFAFNSIYVFTAELFPTSVRSSALAACSLVGRIGSILAPQTPLLSAYVQAFLYGGCSLSAALSVLLIPETQRTHLPVDVQDAERMRHVNPDGSAPPTCATPEPRVRVLSADT